MNKRLFAIINPIVKTVLRSPLHGLMSRNTMLLEFTGRKSGKPYCTPVSYYMANDTVRCVTDKGNQWWRNLVNVDAVDVIVKGRRITGKPVVAPAGSAEVQAALCDLLVASPRDAAFAGVGFDSSGQPAAEDVVRASNTLVLISIELAAP